MGVIPPSLVGVQALYPHPRQEHRLGSCAVPQADSMLSETPATPPARGKVRIAAAKRR
jgi:hypothetical protein